MRKTRFLQSDKELIDTIKNLSIGLEINPEGHFYLEEMILKIIDEDIKENDVGEFIRLMDRR